MEGKQALQQLGVICTKDSISKKTASTPASASATINNNEGSFYQPAAQR
jgi:hypothetical protein